MVGRGEQSTRTIVDMRSTCAHAQHMSKMIQIRDVPDDLHRRVRRRAEEAGMTLSDYLKQELVRIAEQPTMDEVRERIRALRPIEHPLSSAALVREARDRQ